MCCVPSAWKKKLFLRMSFTHGFKCIAIILNTTISKGTDPYSQYKCVKKKKEKISKMSTLSVQLVEVVKTINTGLFIIFLPTYQIQGHEGAGASPRWHWVSGAYTLDRLPLYHSTATERPMVNLKSPINLTNISLSECKRELEYLLETVVVTDLGVSAALAVLISVALPVVAAAFQDANFINLKCFLFFSVNSDAIRYSCEMWYILQIIKIAYMQIIHKSQKDCSFQQVFL